MSDDGERDDEIERYRRRSRKIRSPDDDPEDDRAPANPPPVEDSTVDTRRQSSDTPDRTLADVLAESSGGRPVTVETDSLAVTLVDMPRITVGEFVYDHQVEPSREADTRPVALFDVENTSARPLRWKSARTQFIGDDGYTYQPAHLSLDPSRLGPGCHTRQVEIEPGRRARVVTLVEQLPAGVDIVEVVHAFTARGGRAETERLVFSLE